MDNITIALAGNPNCGKTTLFNALTGASQYVGNWPGVTVERKAGKLNEYPEIEVQDLPGIYSLSPYTLEEVISRDYLVRDEPSVIVDLVDATNLERNLYLTTQLQELGRPIIVALNMADLMARRGITIDKARLSQALHCQVVEISALKGTGIKELVELAVKTAKNPEASRRSRPFRRYGGKSPFPDCGIPFLRSGFEALVRHQAFRTGPEGRGTSPSGRAGFPGHRANHHFRGRRNG